MEKVRLTRIYRSSKDKQGNQLIFKSGKRAGQPYERIAIQTNEHANQWLSGFSDEKNMGWVEGMEVSIIVERNGDFINFRMPSRLDALEARMDKLEKFMGIKKEPEKVEADFNPNDIPF